MLVLSIPPRETSAALRVYVEESFEDGGCTDAYEWYCSCRLDEKFAVTNFASIRPPSYCYPCLWRSSLISRKWKEEDPMQFNKLLFEKSRPRKSKNCLLSSVCTRFLTKPPLVENWLEVYVAGEIRYIKDGLPTHLTISTFSEAFGSSSSNNMNKVNNLCKANFVTRTSLPRHCNR